MTDFRSIVSGSSGNCTLFSDGKTKFLIDCGISGKKITAYLNDMGINPADLDGILVTHEHIDHTSGVGILSRKFDIPIIASAGTWENMQVGNITDSNKVVFDKIKPIKLGNITVTPFEIPHDASQPTGYHIEIDGKRYALATDMGFVSDSVVDILSGCTATIIEANYDSGMLINGPYPSHLKKRIGGIKGHLDNKDTGVLATKLAKSGTKHIMLGHLSNENNSPEIAFAEVARELEYSGITVGKDILLSVAARYEKSENLCKNI